MGDASDMATDSRPWLLVVKGQRGTGTYREGTRHALFAMRGAAEQVRAKAWERGFDAELTRPSSAEAMADYLDKFFDGGTPRR